MSVNKKTTVTESDDIDLGKLVGELIDHRKLIISITALFTLIAIIYALFATPVYQADAMVQVEEKQANAILSNLSQMLPDSQPQSAPEIALLQSRMILGKTVDDLNLQTIVSEVFSFVWEGWAKLTGQKSHSISVSRFYVGEKDNNDETDAILKVLDSKNYTITGENFELKGTVGELVEGNGVSVKINEIDAP